MTDVAKYLTTSEGFQELLRKFRSSR